MAPRESEWCTKMGVCLRAKQVPSRDGWALLNEVPLTTARDLAAEARAMLAEGRDPLEERRGNDADEASVAGQAKQIAAEVVLPTFREFADVYIGVQEEGGKPEAPAAVAKHDQHARRDAFRKAWTRSPSTT